jgi:hypothetical protein
MGGLDRASPGRPEDERRLTLIFRVQHPSDQELVQWLRALPDRSRQDMVIRAIRLFMRDHPDIWEVVTETAPSPARPVRPSEPRPTVSIATPPLDPIYEHDGEFEL